MSFRGRGGGGFGGRGRGGGGGGFRGGRGGGGGGGRFADQGPPDHVVPFGSFAYSCQDDLICKAEIENVPYFNAPIFLENKEQIGKVDEIFGTVRDYSISIKLSEGMKANSFKPQQKLFIDPNKLLPLARFLPGAPGQRGRGVSKPGGGRGGRGGGGRGGGGRGGGFGGRGGGGGFGGRGGGGGFGGRGGGGFGGRGGGGGFGGRGGGGGGGGFGGRGGGRGRF